MFPGAEVRAVRPGGGGGRQPRRWESTGPGPRRTVLFGLLALVVVGTVWFLTGVPLPPPLHVHSRAELERAADDFNRIAPVAAPGWAFCPELSRPSAHVDPWHNRVQVDDTTDRGELVLAWILPDRRDVYHVVQTGKLAGCDGP